MDPMVPASVVSSRYEIIAKIASGGMATVYLGALKGPFGFEQLVAIKKLHAHLLDDPNVRESLLMEARLASRIRHANVVDVRDIEVFADSVQLVMTYIEGATLAGLLNNTTPHKKKKMPPAVAIRIILDICAGLHAAHELVDSRGKPLELVHRDVSPQNVLIGVDGIARITDFGVARDESSQRLRSLTGALKGKFAYMAPEYIRGQRPDRRVDVFALGVVLWEALAGRRLFKGNNDAETISRVTEMEAPRISDLIPELGEGIDAVFQLALSKNPETRYATARALGLALEKVAAEANMIATADEVSQFVRESAREDLERLDQLRNAYARGNAVSEPRPNKGDLPADVATVISADGGPSVKIKAAGPVATPRVVDSLVNRQPVAAMMFNEGTPTVQEPPPSPNPEKIAPTLRTPAIKHIERPPPSLEIVSAPSIALEHIVVSQPVVSQAPLSPAPLSPAPLSPAPVSQPIYGRFGTEVMIPPAPSLREHVLSQGATSATGSPPGEKPSHITVVTLPLPIKRDDVVGAPLNRDKRRARLRWLLAACLVFVISAVGIVLFIAPNAHRIESLPDPKK